MHKNFNFKKKNGIFFFITGLPGSGKSSIAKKIMPKIQKNFGKTILFHGDEIRKIFSLNKYSSTDRRRIALQYVKLCKKLTNNNINVILATVSLFDSIRNWNKKNFKNYIEIYIKADLKKIIKSKKKFFYKKETKNVVGLSIKPEYPKKPNIKIKNDLKEDLNKLSKTLYNKIIKLNLKIY